ncbi:hypothetical protein Lser_V15G12936 [Lactuca serriola]
MEENKESSSIKHQISNLEGGSSNIDNQNKHTEAINEAENPLDHNKISGETQNPVIHNSISGEDEDPLDHKKFSGENDNPPIYNKISSEAELTLDHNKISETENPVVDNIISGEAENLPIHNKLSGEAEDPNDDNKISGKTENPLVHNNISGKSENPLIHSMSSKDENLPILNKLSSKAEDPLIDNKNSGDASPTSFSSSSNLLELDYDENAFDISFSISEEDEDATNTRQWSMVSASPTAVQELPLSPENASPKQSPVVQVMERTDSYDPNRIPSSTFSRKLTDTTEWSVDSSDSLFSLHLGKSGELNRADSSFRLPTVIETTSEIDQKSTIGEIQNQSDVPIVSANGNGVNPSETPCDSVTTLQEQEQQPPPPPVPEGNVEENVAAETKSDNRVTSPKGRCRCFNCFSCCTFCG